jgi:hypothetical protein
MVFEVIMALRLELTESKKNSNGLLAALPRFSLDLRIGNKKVILQYVPVVETLYQMIKQKKGIIEVSSKQFSIFKIKSTRSQNTYNFNP